MTRNRGEDPTFLGQRWDRFKQLLASRDIWDKRDIRAYLLTPREEFVTRQNLGRAYEWHYLNIGYGVTITGPHTVARMTNSMDVKFGDKVLEIGTGSGTSVGLYLSNLTDQGVGRSRSSSRWRSAPWRSNLRSRIWSAPVQRIQGVPERGCSRWAEPQVSPPARSITSHARSSCKPNGIFVPFGRSWSHATQGHPQAGDGASN